MGIWLFFSEKFHKGSMYNQPQKQMILAAKWLEEIERLKIPSPVYLKEKSVFEYEKVNVEIVAFLKAVRATQSLQSLPILHEKGLFYDFYTVIRCICECVNQIYFLLETYPKTSNHVDNFVTHFAGTTIENSKTQNSHGIKQHIIHSAAARARTSDLPREKHHFGESEERTKKLLDNIWTAVCNSVHSNYADIMQIYGGPIGNPRFQLQGVPSIKQKQMNAEWIPQANDLVIGSLHFIASRFGLNELEQEIRTHIQSDV